MSDRVRRILVATDGSPESENAFAAMMPIVRSDDPEVALLYVFESPGASFVAPARVAKACSALRANRVNAYLELREGRPAEEIVRLARDRGSDLIVMSTHGRGGLQRLVLGSVAEQVIRRSETPVLVTRPGVVVRDWDRLLVPLDGSPGGEAILRDVIPLARRLKSSVELIQTTLPPITMTGVGDIPGVVIHEDALPYLRNMQARLSSEGIQAMTAALEGRAAFEILRRAKDAGTSLLCMSTHGRTGFGRVLMGSVAEEVLRHAPCPLLLRRSLPAEPAPEVQTGPATTAFSEA